MSARTPTSPVAAPDGPLHLVVIGDSTSFTDEVGPQLPRAEHLYPNVLGRLLGEALGRPVEVTVLARAGMTVREAARMLTKDRHVQFEVLPTADAVVVGVGSNDLAPGGVPPVLEAAVPYLRPARLRREARRALHRLNPLLVRATLWRLRRTPPAEFDRLYDQILLLVRGLTQGVPGVVVGPTSHRSRYYAHRHPRHPENEAHVLAIAARHGFAAVPCWHHVLPHADHLNPDGIHWPAPVHAAVAADLAAALVAQLRGEVPAPGVPWDERADGADGADGTNGA